MRRAPAGVTLALLLLPLGGCLLGYDQVGLGGEPQAAEVGETGGGAGEASEGGRVEGAQATETPDDAGMQGVESDDAGAPAEGVDGGDSPETVVPEPFTGAELWLSAEDWLVRAPLGPLGGVERYEFYPMPADVPQGMTSLTRLPGGGLLMSRTTSATTLFYIVPEPPRDDDGREVSVMALGNILGDLLVEGLFTACDGDVYVFDSGTDTDTTMGGGRVLRFTGQVTLGEYATEVTRDFGDPSPDYDDLGPAIVDNELVDSPMLAIDTGAVHSVDVAEGTSTVVVPDVRAGLGVHALGRTYFDDDQARLYVLSRIGDVVGVDPETGASQTLIEWPDRTDEFRAFSGLGGSLTDCTTGLP